MIKAFNYRAKNIKGEIVTGCIFAETLDIALAKLRMMNYRVSTTPQINWYVTLSSLGQKSFNPKALAAFYKTLSRATKSGRSITASMSDAVQYTSDVRLKQSLMLCRHLLSEGVDLPTSLKHSGFPERDTKIIEAAQNAGSVDDVLMRLHNELLRDLSLSSAIKKMVAKPIFLLIFAYVAIYLVFFFVAPTMGKFFKNMSGVKKIPENIQMFYNFTDAFNENILFSSIIYAGIGIGIFMFFNSQFLKSMLQRIKLINDISLKKDLSQTWNSFALLYTVGTPIKSTIDLVSRAAQRNDVKDWFAITKKNTNSGLTLGVATAQAGFPSYISDEIKAAESASDISIGMKEMADGLSEEVDDLIDVLKNRVDIILIFLSAFVVIGFFALTLLPIIVMTMNI